MKHAPVFSSCRLWTLLVTGVLVLLDASPLVGQNWPQFRGPTGDGHVAGKKLVASWSESENIRWKGAVPRGRLVLAGDLGRPVMDDLGPQGGAGTLCPVYYQARGADP